MSNAVELIEQALADVQAEQGKRREKANTVVATIGAVITGALAAVTEMIDAGLALPEWTPALVGVLGAIGTIFGVSRVKNGVTPSIKKSLVERVQDLFDEDNDSPEGKWLQGQRDSLLHRAEEELSKRGIEVDLTPDLPWDEASLTMHEGAPEPRISEDYVGDHRVAE